jgi:hypothetical protein
MVKKRKKPVALKRSKPRRSSKRPAEFVEKPLPTPPTRVEVEEVKARPEKASVPSPERRFTYDGDTAFKLYLREIGQVKL